MNGIIFASFNRKVFAEARFLDTATANELARDSMFLLVAKRCFYFIASALHFKHDYLKNILLVICIQNIISWALNFLAAKTSQQVDTDIVWLAYILGAFINIYYFIFIVMS